MITIDTKLRPVKQDWRNSKIKMFLEDKGWTLRQLSAAHGRSACAAAQALHSPTCPQMEIIIADAIGIEPSEIWPSRYPGGVRAPSHILRRVAKNTTPRCTTSNQAGDAP